MTDKKIEVTLQEEILADMDALIKAGFYKNREDIIWRGLMTIEPLKFKHEQRFGERMRLAMRKI